jgi:hypothetical protein
VSEAPAHEARRQQRLLAAVHGGDDGLATGLLAESGERAAQGLQAYRANAGAVAERALRTAFPTLQAMLGEADFRALAREFWCACPPQRGDLGEWGDELPAWLEVHGALSSWPYLADCARLDLAVHRCERAADAAFDAQSLALLAGGEPRQLRLCLMPGSALIRSAWPIATIHAAHQDDAGGFDAAHDAIAQRRGECGLVARRGWRGVVYRIDPGWADWTDELLDGADLQRALERAGASFDFAVWLAAALREGWLKGAERLPD